MKPAERHNIFVTVALLSLHTEIALSLLYFTMMERFLERRRAAGAVEHV